MMLETSVRSLVAAALVALVLWAFRVRSPRVRHGVWTAFVVAMLLMPVLLPMLPSVSVPVPAEVEPYIPEPPSFSVPSAPMAVEVPYAKPPAERPAVDWYGVAIWVYWAGVVVFTLRLFAGLLTVLRLRRGSVECGPQVRQSSLVKVPMTVGLLRPVILLPEDWCFWSDAKRDAILAHERTHVARRDGLVLLLAGLNRCVFWFHPVAWWLQRELARLAEEVCDDAGAAAVGDRAAYAEMLLAMASGMQLAPGRLAFGAGGVAGRIERVLRGPVSGSALKFATACVCCVVVILIAVSTDVTSTAAPHIDYSDGFFVAGRMTAAEVKQNEDVLARNPEDVKARKNLLFHYSRVCLCGPEFKTHMVWLIEHHPDSPLLGSTHWGNDSDNAVIRKLWLEKTKGNVSAQVLMNASRYFDQDRDTKEQLLLRANLQSPGIASSRLGSHYFVSLNMKSPIDQQTRKKLEETRDAALLVSVAVHLRGAQHVYANKRMDFDPLPLAEHYSERAKKLNGNAEVKVPESQNYQALLGFASMIQPLDRVEGKPQAMELLRLAAKQTDSDDRDAGIHYSHIWLGRMALKAGKTKEAVRELKAASEVSTCDWLRYNGVTLKLQRALLALGERDAVASYLEKMGRTTTVEIHRERFLAYAKEIRLGKTPAMLYVKPGGGK